MAYEIRYTDTVNKGSIFVEDGTLNSETSLVLPGRNVTSYGQAVAENFLHLLENFANTEAPERPVEGQLWYDNSDGVDQLKVYDGTNWAAAGGLKKASSEPAVANSSAGDLWVNTENQQLYLFTGSAWILVGPDFSDGLLTGTQAENIIGTDDKSYNVLTVKIEDKPAIIISSQEFIPKTAIAGFRTGIKPGINISSIPLIGNQQLKYYGTAEKAEALVVGGQVISASNFLRGDGVSSSDFELRVRNNEGIKIGTESQFTLGVSETSGVITNNTNGSSIDFRLNNGNLTPTVVRIDSTGNVGINNLAPEENLDIRGNIKVAQRVGEPETGFITVESTIQSDNIGTGSIVTKGGVGISRNLNVGGDADIGGVLTTNNIVPDQPATRNIGTTNNKFNQIHATSFIGNLQGNVNGTVSGRSGSADRLASATTFAVGGDVENSSFEFDGQTGGSTKTFDIRIANSFISNKQEIFDISNADELLINKTTGETGVYRVKKSNFLKTIPLVPAGVVLPFGGNRLPPGWLLCDGSEVKKTDFFLLWEAIGHNFRDPQLLSDLGVNTFALPDMRGRFPLGLDNIGGQSANRVTDLAADSIGGNSGNESKDIVKANLPDHDHDLNDEQRQQYYAVRVSSAAATANSVIPLTLEPGLGGTLGLASSGGIKGGGALGNNVFREITNAQGEVIEKLGAPFNVMNPFLAFTYIIYTGQ
jgi:microcystin-dependent protein